MELTGAHNNLQPIAVLIDELKDEDVSLRINAVKRLSTIALALGFERTRDELIPFLQESMDEEDEVLLVVAEELGKFVEYVGGPKYSHLLLQPLESLAAIEETIVREKAIVSIVELGKVLSNQQCEEYFFPMVKRLASGDWFTRRSSATGLITPVYEKLSPAAQEELRKIIVSLCHDETPMVRRPAATSLAKLTKVVNKQLCLQDLLPAVTFISQDEQDSVRHLTVDILISLGGILDPEEIHNIIFPIFRSMLVDKSWRVRYAVANRFSDLRKSLGERYLNEELCLSYVNLLKDFEAEVRTAATNQLPAFCSAILTDLALKHILPCLKELAIDTSQHVRAALAIQINDLSPVMGKECTLNSLLPLFLQLLKDDFHEVRLNIISKLDNVNEVIGIDLLSQSLLPAVVQLAEDKQWRVRLAIIEYIPILAKQLGVDFFNSRLSTLCLSWLSDSVFAIREAAIINLKNLIVVFGSDWAVQFMIPKLLELTKSTNYLYRVTLLLAVATIGNIIPAAIVLQHLFPVIKTMAKDAVPNVRFNVCKCLQALIPIFYKSDRSNVVNESVKPVLLDLSKDLDNDVKYFATKALSICS